MCRQLARNPARESGEREEVGRQGHLCFHLQPCLWAVPLPLSKAATEQLSARLSEAGAGSTMPCVFPILGCHVLLAVCAQDRLQRPDGSTPKPRLAGEGWVPDQPEAGQGERPRLPAGLCTGRTERGEGAGAWPSCRP